MEEEENEDGDEDALDRGESAAAVAGGGGSSIEEAALGALRSGTDVGAAEERDGLLPSPCSVFFFEF